MNFFNHCCKKCSQQESNPQLVLSRRLLYPFNYRNKCHIFGLFQPFSVTATNFMNSITFVMNHLISYFDISICHCSNRTLCYHLFKFHGFNYGYFLGDLCPMALQVLLLSCLQSHQKRIRKKNIIYNVLNVLQI